MDDETRQKAAVDRLMKKATRQTLLPDDNRIECQAQVRLYVNRKLGGNWVRCSKRKRAGKRTCWWHRALEGEDAKPTQKYAVVQLDGVWGVHRRLARPFSFEPCESREAAEAKVAALNKQS